MAEHISELDWGNKAGTFFVFTMDDGSQSTHVMYTIRRRMIFDRKRIRRFPDCRMLLGQWGETDSVSVGKRASDWQTTILLDKEAFWVSLER
jgi:hypothetical protein